jgi:choline dehydrogenase
MSTAETWDYIIVGAGAAGCVLANRLTESGRYRVLLLEAGGNDNHLWIRVPAGFTRTMFDKRISWGYENAPGPAISNRKIPCPRGKVLGGSSSINGHAYVRGQAKDYEDWVALGATGWGWSDVLPYFKRAETRVGDCDPSVRGTSGPLIVNDPRLQHPLSGIYLQTMQRSLAQQLNPDYNSGDQEGCGFYQHLMQRGRRWSAADAYLRPAMQRPNLAVRTHAQATRIEFEGRRAVGVRFKVAGETHTARAAREVILAAGAINSPQLLQLSGIGDPALLGKMQITVVAPSAGVGRNLVDHYAARIAVRVRGAPTLNERSHGVPLIMEALKYVFQRRGLLTMAPSNAYGFVRAVEGATRPDTQLLFTPASSEVGQVVGQAKLEREPGMTCGVLQLRPYSRGHVRIVDRDPFAAPEIQPNYLADPRDSDTLLAGLRFVRRLFAAQPLATFVAAENWPGPSVASDDEMIDFARRTGSTVYHPVGTCRMGAEETLPVDTSLRVRGVEALRVIDASVMPSMISGNTYATTVMIAERGADFLLR